MQRVRKTLEWKVEWWNQHQKGWPGLDEPTREGVSAYMSRQAHIQQSLHERFTQLWENPLVPLATGEESNEGPGSLIHCLRPWQRRTMSSPFFLVCMYLPMALRCQMTSSCGLPHPAILGTQKQGKVFQDVQKYLQIYIDLFSGLPLQRNMVKGQNTLMEAKTAVC